MRDLVRTQLDLDDSDLPDPLLDAFLQEGYDRVTGLEQRWPFFESVWTIVTDTNGVASIPLDVLVIEQLTANGYALRHIDLRWAIGMFGDSTQISGTPAYWAVLNRRLKVWPGSGGAGHTLTGYGFRRGADWIGGGAGAECDCDRRLHIPICWYAASLGYAQQEDEVLEQTYLNRFKESSALARDSIMRAWTGSPKQVSYTTYPQPWGGPGRPPQLVFQLPDGSTP